VSPAGFGAGPPPDILVIINPASGPARRGRAEERIAIAARVLSEAGTSHRIQLTERRNHAYDLAAAAVEAGVKLVIAWGGDGTLNEVGQALAFRNASLGLIPGGSGNGFARELKIPFDPELALRRTLSGSDRVIDAGEIAGRMFFNVAGIGLDAKVAADVSASNNRRGLVPYLAASARELVAYFPCEYAIETDAGAFRKTALVIALANSPQYGYAARIAPGAQLDDGVLDLVIVEPRSFVGNAVRIPSLFTGTFHRSAGVSLLRVRQLRVSSKTRMLFHLDGEVIEGERELTARVHAKALRVRA
jgi:diacylglycerol kinase (ATP)